MMALREGAVRAAEALLRANGGRNVVLRMPGLAASGDDAEQLGLATPGFQDVVLGPVVFRKAESPGKLLVSGAAVAAIVGSMAFDSAEVLFEQAVGVVVGNVLYEVESCVASVSGGVAYCYAVGLKAPVWRELAGLSSSDGAGE
jgi:hypothetical protein